MKLSTIILSLMSATSVAAINRGAKKEAASPLRRKLGMNNMGGGGGCSVNAESPAVFETADASMCTICDEENKNKPSALTLIYNPVGVNSDYQDECKATCREDTYPDSATISALDKNDNVLGEFSNLSIGQSFTVNASDEDTLDAITNFQISGWTNGDDGNECFIHTSCSQPLVVGDQLGPFIVAAGTGCDAPCLEVELDEYTCSDNMTIKVSFDWSATVNETNYGGTATGYDDWIGIYPCDIEFYKHPESWLWACGEFGQTSLECSEALQSGDLTFQNPMPVYNEPGNHEYPVTPFYLDDDVTVNTCFQAVLLRYAGPSTPPYVKVCESQQFDILEGSCAIRERSDSYPHNFTGGIP
jgi:hypothetical protein